MHKKICHAEVHLTWFSWTCRTEPCSAHPVQLKLTRWRIGTEMRPWSQQRGGSSPRQFPSISNNMQLQDPLYYSHLVDGLGASILEDFSAMPHAITLNPRSSVALGQFDFLTIFAAYEQ